jgi:hypothetical protein
MLQRDNINIKIMNERQKGDNDSSCTKMAHHGEKGPQIVMKPQNTRQKDGFRIRWNAT